MIFTGSSKSRQPRSCGGRGSTQPLAFYTAVDTNHSQRDTIAPPFWLRPAVKYNNFSLSATSLSQYQTVPSSALWPSTRDKLLSKAVTLLPQTSAPMRGQNVISCVSNVRTTICWNKLSPLENPYCHAHVCSSKSTTAQWVPTPFCSKFLTSIIIKAVQLYVYSSFSIATYLKWGNFINLLEPPYRRDEFCFLKDTHKSQDSAGFVLSSR